MQNDHLNLGERQSIHRTFPLSILFWPVFLVPLLLTAIAAAFYTFASFTSADKGAGPVICLGGSCLLLAVLGSVWIGDLRKWLATRTVKLSIYQAGFTYESKGQIEACQWGEIKDITFRRIEIRTKHSAPRKVNVIQSIVRSDGRMIGLTETLKLIEITKLITTANDEYRKRMGVQS